MTQISIFPKLVAGTFSSPAKLWQNEIENNKNSSIEEFLLRKVLSFYTVVFFLYYFTKTIFNHKSYLNLDNFMLLISIFYISSLFYLFLNSAVFHFLVRTANKKIDFKTSLQTIFYISIPINLSLTLKNIPSIGNYLLFIFYIYSLYLLWKAIDIFLDIKVLKKKLRIFIFYILIINIIYFCVMYLILKTTQG